MLPNPNVARVVRATLFLVALATAMVLVLRSLGAKPATVTSAEEHLEAAELERETTAVRAAAIASRAAEARGVAKPVAARAKVLQTRVAVERSGQLRIQDNSALEATFVPVPPVVTDLLQADSAAISALSVALTWDSSAVAIQEKLLLADAKALEASRLTITQLEHQRSPRCGRRCGMVLGAASIVALGIAAGQTRHLLRR